MLESFLIGLAANFCTGIISSLSKKSEVDVELQRAYNRALKKWSINSGIRSTQEYLTRKRFEQLSEYLNGDKSATEIDSQLHDFIKIFEKEISDSENQSAFNYVVQKSNKFIAENTKELNNILKRQFPEKEFPQLKIFRSPTPHIPRTVSGDATSSDLIKLIKENRQIVLVGEGGLGKTIELEYVAYLLPIEGWYCGLIRLIDYATTLEQLIEINFKNWQNLDSNCRILILLDGLDEVENTMIHRVENEIKQFCKANRQVHFLISFRDSYLFLQNQSEDELKDENRVKHLHLDPIPIEQIHTYIVENAQNPEYLIGQIEKHKLFEICRNPFYLINFIWIYQSQNYIPINKSDFFNRLIESRIKNEEKKGGAITELVLANERKLLANLEQLALTMQLAGKYKISNSDCQLVINKEKIRKTAIRLVLIHQSDLYKHYRFEHNNFQEYLAAKRLTSFAWEQIQQIIFLPNRKLKPKWRNALSFFINLIDSESELFHQLADWLINYDIESLIKTEIIHLDQTVRNHIFYSIYDSYKIKQITFSNDINEKQLSDFCSLGKNHELLRFLISEISEDTPIQILSNIVLLFNDTNEVEHSFRSKIVDSLLPFLRNDNYNKYLVNSTIVNLLSKWKFYDPVLVENLLSNDIILKNGHTRISFQEYLINGNIRYVTANFIFRSIIAKEKENVIFGDIYYLRGVVILLAPLQIMNLLELFTPQKENESKQFVKSDFIELFEVISKQAAVYYRQEPLLLNIVLEFIKASIFYYKRDYVKPFRSFFKDNGIALQEFIKAFNEEKQKPDNRRIKFFISGFLADEQCLSWVIRQYRDKVITDENVLDFLWSLNWSDNIEMNKLFYVLINIETNNLFIPKPNQWDEAHKESDRLWHMAILDKNLFIEYIDKAFDYLGKDQISNEEYWTEYDKEEYQNNSDYIVCQDCLKLFIEKDKLTLRSETIEWINDKNNWENIQLNEHYQLVKNQILPPENIQWIINWCSEHKSQINFKKAIKQTGTATNINNFAICYIQFSLSIVSILNDNDTLLNMVYCISDFFTSYENGKLGEERLNLYDYLKKNISKQELNGRIIQHLHDGIEADQVLEKHIEVIEDENLIDAIIDLPKYILNKEISIYVRIKILRTYLNLGGDIFQIESLLSELNFDDQVDWNLVDEFIKKDYPKVGEKLLEYLEDKNINKPSLAIYLIKASQIKGFELLQKIITENNSSVGIEAFRHGSFAIFVKSSKLKTSDVFSYLFSFLELYLNPKFIMDDFDNCITQIFDLFTFYLTNGNDHLFENIENSILALLEKSENTNNYQLIYRYLQKLQQDMNVYLDSDIGIEVAFRKLKSMQ